MKINKATGVWFGLGVLSFILAPHNYMAHYVMRLFAPLFFVLAAIRERQVRARKREEEQERIQERLLKNLRESQ